MDVQVIARLKNQFDGLIHGTTEENIEFWFAREIQQPLGYARWENFVKVVRRGIESCKTAGCESEDHFRGVTKMVRLGSGSEREIDLWRIFCRP